MAASFVQLIAVVLALLPLSAVAEPITLKVSFWSSDRSPAYLSLVKPFVDAINREGRDLLNLKVYFSGALSPVISKQPQLVLDGVADIAFIVPGENPDRFPDNVAIEIPGLFRDTREASLVHTRLVAAKALRGYEDFYVIAAVGTEPETIHSRNSTGTLSDLIGQRIRVNNNTAATAVALLGGLPLVLALNNTMSALGNGDIDAAVLQAAQVLDTGVSRLAANHYLLPFGSAPLALVLNRKVFDKLPEPAKDLIRKYSGEWAVARYVEISDAIGNDIIAKLKADHRRKVIVASAEDQAAAQQVFDAVAENWALLSPRNYELLKLVRAEVAKLHSVK